MPVDKIIFHVCGLGDHRSSKVRVEVNENYFEPLFDLVKKELPYLEEFMNAIGFYIPYHGFRIVEGFSIYDLIQLNNGAGRESNNLVFVVQEFDLKFKNGFVNTFKFASCAGFNNALEFLRALLKLHEDDQVFVGDDRVDNSMSINSMLENNYLVTISIVKAAGPPTVPLKAPLSSLEIKSHGVSRDIEHYMDTAKRILAENETLLSSLQEEIYPLSALCNDIKSASLDKSFFFVSGPSFSGKTKLIYVFDQLSKYPMSVENKSATIISYNPHFYCVLHLVMEIEEAPQNIYTAQMDFSESILEAIRLDYRDIYGLIADILKGRRPDSPSLRILLEDLGVLCDDFKVEGSRDSLIFRLKDLLPYSTLCSMIFIEGFCEFYAWRSLGILSAIVDLRVKGMPLDVSVEIDKILPMSLDEFHKKHCKENPLPILFCLDEFNLSMEKYRKPLIMLTNLLRCIPGLSVMLLGTNVGVVRVIVRFSKINTVSLNPWCRIVYKLPPASLNTLAVLEPAFLEKIDRNFLDWLNNACGRPGIFKLFLESMVETGAFEFKNLKSALEITLGKLLTLKKDMANFPVMEGYYQMIFSNFYRKYVYKHSCSTELAHKHLAHMISDEFTQVSSVPVLQNLYKGSDPSALYTQTDTNVSRKFYPRSLYLDLKRDELTQMIIFSDWLKRSPVVDNKLENIFQKASSAASIINAKQEIIHNVIAQDSLDIFCFSFRLFVEILHNQTTIYSRRAGIGFLGGNKLEKLINGAFVKASASAGPSGDTLERFLLKFVSELSIEKLFNFEWNESLSLIHTIKDQLVPYVIATDYRMSSAFRSIPNTYTGYLPTINLMASAFLIGCFLLKMRF